MKVINRNYDESEIERDENGTPYVRCAECGEPVLNPGTRQRYCHRLVRPCAKTAQRERAKARRRAGAGA